MVAMQHDALFVGQREFGRQSALDTRGLGRKAHIAILRAVAISDGDMRPDAMFQKNCRQQVDDFLSRISAMDEVLGAMLNQEVQRPPRFAEMIMRVRKNTDFHSSGSFAVPLDFRNSNFDSFKRFWLVP